MSQLLSWNKANCSLLVFDKENLIESPLDLLHYIYNYYVAMLLISHGLHVTCQLTPLSHIVTVTPCDNHSVTTITPLWLYDLSRDIFPHSTLVIKEKKRKGKEILNNDLAILPSHNTGIFPKGGLTGVLGMVSMILHVMWEGCLIRAQNVE